MSLTTSVQALIGSIPSGITLYDALTDGAKDVIRRVELSNPKELWLFTVSTKPCKAILPNLRHRAAETDSIHYATGEFPVYYLLDGKVFVLPAPGIDSESTHNISVLATYDSGGKTQVTTETLHGYSQGDYIDIAQSDPNNPQTYVGTFYINEIIDTANFIINRDYVATAVTGYTTIRTEALCQKIALPSIDGTQDTAGAIDNFPASYYSLVILYGAMVAILRKMSDLHDGLPTLSLPSIPVSPEILTPSEGLPVYAAPSPYIAPVTPENIDVDFSGVPLTPVYSGPTSPPLSIVSFTTSKVPVYIKPVFSPPLVPNIPLLSLPLSPPPIESANFSDPSSSLAASNQPDYTPPIMEVPDFTYIEETLLKADEDSELASVSLSSIQAKIGKYQAELQNSLNSYNKENGIYQQLIQESLSNGAKTLDKENQEFQSRLANHNTEIQRYQAEVNSTVQDWTKNNIENSLNKWNQEFNNGLNQYQQDMANSLNSFNRDMAEYQTETQKVMQDATNSMTQENTEYSSTLQKFQAELEEYKVKTANELAIWQAEVVQPAITEFQQTRNDDVQTWQAENTQALTKYQTDIQSSTTDFESDLKIWSQEIQKAFSTHQQETGYDLQEYQAKVQEESTRYQADAETANSTHKAQTEKLQADIQLAQSKNEANMGKHNSEVQKYQAEATALAGEFQANIEKSNIEYQWLTGKYQTLQVQYESGFLTQPKKGDG